MRHALLAVVLAGCTSSPPGGAPQPAAPQPAAPSPAPVAAAPPPAPVAPANEMAPTPYTAEQIRAACPAGTVFTFRREIAGAPASLLVLRFVNVDEAGADVESLARDDDGKNTGQPKIEHATWEQLRGHASFPLAATTIETGVADTPAGQFRARIYTVRKGDEVSRFYFADERPGPPVLFYTEKAGVRAVTSTLVPNPPPPVACKTADDCWIDDQQNPIARPRKLRGKKPRACKDSERIPACDQSVCVVRAYKC